MILIFIVVLSMYLIIYVLIRVKYGKLRLVKFRFKYLLDKYGVVLRYLGCIIDYFILMDFLFVFFLGFKLILYLKCRYVDLYVDKKEKKRRRVYGYL